MISSSQSTQPLVHAQTMARLAVIYLLPWFVFVPPVPIAGTPLSLDDVLPLVLVGLGVLLRPLGPAPRFEVTTALLLVFALLCLGSTLVTNATGHDLLRSAARGFGRSVFFAAMLMVIVRVLRDRRDAERLMGSIVVAAVAQSVFCVFAYVTDYHGPANIGVAPTPPWTTLRRVHGTFAGWADASEGLPVSANFLSAYLMVCAVLAIGLALRARGATARLLWLAGAGACVAGIGVSFGRASLVGLALGLFVMAALTRRFAVVAALVAVMAVSLVAVPGLAGRMRSLDSDRLALYAAGARIAYDHPGFGIGDGNYLRTMKNSPSYRVTPWGIPTSTPHNSILLAAAHAGWVAGAVLLLAVALALARMALFTAWARDERTRTLLATVTAAACAFCFQDLFNNLLFVPKTAAFFWMLVALSLVLGHDLAPPLRRPARAS